MASLIEEFKEFALRGNVVDLAVGVIIGAAFNEIVNSLVNDVIMPPIGALIGDVDFSNLYVNLSPTDYPSLDAAVEAGAPLIRYGLFLNNVIQFLIVALVVFLLVRGINRLHREPEKVESVRACPYCHSDIPIKATRCPYCTSQIDAAQALSTP